jgi:hypothetical protein
MATKKITPVNPDTKADDEADTKDAAAERKTAHFFGRYRKMASASGRFRKTANFRV